VPDRRIHRPNYDTIFALVEPASRVLDLGCGEGQLLARLIAEKQVQGRGVDIQESMVRACIARGLSVFQGDLDEGLKDFATGSYDYVILNQTLQATHRPVLVVSEMLRVGRRAIVAFPNFGHLPVRLQLLLSGRMPVTPELPYQWHDTPNIHLCTRRDFIIHCRSHGIRIERIVDLGRPAWLCRIWPNLLAREVIFVLSAGAGDAGEPVAGADTRFPA
jgi:methionine biosynthesis protein MetW